MKKRELTPEEEYELYKDHAYHEPLGPGRRRKTSLTELVPVRFSPEVLAEIRERASADDRSVSSWIRRAVADELERNRKAEATTPKKRRTS